MLSTAVFALIALSAILYSFDLVFLSGVSCGVASFLTLLECIAGDSEP